jgi:hypothetical protein
MARSADYPRQMLCRECRIRMAGVALAGSAELIETLWLVTTYFSYRRHQLILLSRERSDPPRPQVIASVARGLLEQGYVDDGLVLAALAIQGGEEADVNRVGASALGVMLDPLLARPGIESTLRAALYGS